MHKRSNDKPYDMHLIWCVVTDWSSSAELDTKVSEKSIWYHVTYLWKYLVQNMSDNYIDRLNISYSSPRFSMLIETINKDLITLYCISMGTSIHHILGTLKHILVLFNWVDRIVFTTNGNIQEDIIRLDDSKF